MTKKELIIKMDEFLEEVSKVISKYETTFNRDLLKTQLIRYLEVEEELE